MKAVNVVEVTVVTGLSGTDEVVLTLDFVEGIHPYTSPAKAKILVAKGLGEEYALKNFRGCPVSVTHGSTGETTLWLAETNR